MLFESPSAFEACTNTKVKVVYDRQVREGAPKMAGAFCIHPIMPGEFICAWNGVQIVEDDDNIEALLNVYDLSKYALSFPSGAKDKALLYSSPRLDKNGKPLPLPLKKEDMGDASDVSLAVFLNEPSPHHVTTYNARTDTVQISRASRNSANVCLKTEKQRNGVVCPLMFASRRIRPGEELTWDYGANDYDRRLYDIDEENGVFSVGERKYPATEALSNRCNLTCDTVEFKQGLPISPFSHDLFLLNAAHLTAEDRELVEFRSARYLEILAGADGQSTETASAGSSDSMLPPRKKQKRARRVQRHTVTVESMQDQAKDQFAQELQKLSCFAYKILHELKDITPGRIKLWDKLRTIAVLKSVLLPAVYAPVEENKGNGLKVVHHFPRTEFVPSPSEGHQFVSEGDVMWKDIMKMQHNVFVALDYVNDSLLNAGLKESVAPHFDPNKYTSIYIRADGQGETVGDWDNAEFAATHPTAHRVGVRFLRKLQHIQEMVHHYDEWYRVKQKFDAANYHQSRQPLIRLFGEKGRAFIELALELVQANAYERVNGPVIFKECDSIMRILAGSADSRPLDPARVSEAVKEHRSTLEGLLLSENDEDARRAADMLDMLRQPNIWRSEAMLMRVLNA